TPLLQGVTKSRQFKLLLLDFVRLISVNCRWGLEKIASRGGSSGVDDRGGDNETWLSDCCAICTPERAAADYCQRVGIDSERIPFRRDAGGPQGRGLFV